MTPRAQLAVQRGGSADDGLGASMRLKRDTTDVANAERLVRQHGADLRYVTEWGAWIVWDGWRWKRDDTGEVMRRAKATVAALWNEVALARTMEAKGELAKHARASAAAGRIEAMVKLATTEPGVPVLVEELDANPWLLTVANGTLDLRTGALRAPRREDLLTKRTPVAWDPAATCPTWDRFIARVLGGDAELLDFFCRAVGYSLTGATSEQCLFFLYGNGANGKSTAVETIRALLGDSATQADFTTFLETRNDGVRNDVARLQGARFVSAVEAGEGRRLNEGLVKQLTGGDRITARYLHREFFEFTPRFKLWLAANHKPTIRGADEGIWRRIRLIPFTVTIPESERDAGLSAALRAELPGILAWAVAGCLLWLESGLGAPRAVRDATEQYRTESDTLGAFLSECCMVGCAASETSKQLYERYKGWAEEANEHAVTSKKFGQLLTERGFGSDKRGHANVTWRLGLRLLRPGEEPLTPPPSPLPPPRAEDADEASRSNAFSRVRTLLRENTDSQSPSSASSAEREEEGEKEDRGQPEPPLELYDAVIGEEAP